MATKKWDTTSAAAQAQDRAFIAAVEHAARHGDPERAARRQRSADFLRSLVGKSVQERRAIIAARKA